MTDVFISYSRRDTDFVRRLFDALKAGGREAWVDWQGIDYSTKWWEEICAGIERADNFVLVISPDALNSKYCHDEITHARKHNKRIIPFIYADLDETKWKRQPLTEQALDNWAYLRTLQFISYPKLADFDKSVAALVATVDKDPVHVKAHTELLSAALAWANAGRSPGFLLRDERLAEAENWLSKADTERKDPPPSAEHRAYIAESRRVADAARATARRTRLATITLALAAVVAVGFSLVAANQSTISAQQAATATVAQGQAVEAQGTLAGALTAIPPTLEAIATQVRNAEDFITSLNLASGAVEYLNDDAPNAETAALLAIRGLRTGYSIQADTTLVRALNRLSTTSILEERHWQVQTVTFSPDGRFIATAGYETVEIWDASTSKQVRVLQHSGTVFFAVFSPDSASIVTASSDRKLRIWDVASGAVTRIFQGYASNFNSAAYSPDGKFIVTGSEDGKIRVWESATGILFRIFQGNITSVNSVAYSPDGQYVVAGGDESAIRIWNATLGTVEKTIFSSGGRINTITFSPDGRFILTAGNDNAAHVYDVETGDLALTLIGHTKIITDWVNSAEYDPSGQLIVTTGQDQTARVWDAHTGKMLHVLEGHTSPVQSAVFSPDGYQIATADFDGIVRIWNVYDKVKYPFQRESCWVSSISFNPNGQQFASVCPQGIIRFGNFPSGDMDGFIVGDPRLVTNVAYSPDGKTFLSVNDDNVVRVWDAATYSLVATLKGRYAVYNKDGGYIYTVDTDNTFLVWNTVYKSVESSTVLEKDSRTTLLDISSDGKLVATVDFESNDVQIWDTVTGSQLFDLRGHSNWVSDVSFSPDGKMIVTSSIEGTARIWDAFTGNQLHVLNGHTWLVNSAAFSSDGRLIVTASSDETIRTWNASNGELLRIFESPGISNRQALFTPDGNYIIAITDNSYVNVWHTDYHDFIAYACTRVFRDLSYEERQQYGITDNKPTCPQFAAAS